jgi:hypothetical protein
MTDAMNAEPSHRAGILTFRKVFPIVLLLMIFVLAVRQSTSLDPDLWWHLKAGEEIVQSKGVPHVDDFSFTKNGSEWVAHEWLSEVLMYGAYRLTGIVGLVTIFSLLIVGIYWMVYRRCDGQPYCASLAVLMGAAAASPLFGIRPQMLTLLLAAIFISLLERFARDGNKRHLYWLPPLMLLWVNLHAGFALGLALIGLYMIGVLLDGSWRKLKPLAIILCISVALVPLNPNGFRMFSYPYETLTSTSMAAFIEEWASPNFHKSMYLPLAILLFCTFAVLALTPKRVQNGELFLLLVTAFGALRSVRHIPIFTLIAVPIFARYLWATISSRGWDSWFTSTEQPPNTPKLIINVALLLAVITLAFSRIWAFAHHQRTYEGIRNPVAAVDFIKERNLPAPIYNKYGWGGYLIYRLYPEYRVYIDGRADVYGDQFFAEAMRAYDGLGDWPNSLDRFGINTVLIAPDAALASLLKNDSSKWKVVYEDDQSIIFCRTLFNR